MAWDGRMDGDLIFVVDQFIGKNQIAIFDVFLSSEIRGPKVFRVEKGHLILPSKTGDVDMGELLLITHPAADIAAALGEKLRDREVVLIPSVAPGPPP